MRFSGRLALFILWLVGAALFVAGSFVVLGHVWAHLLGKYAPIGAAVACGLIVWVCIEVARDVVPAIRRERGER